MSVIVFAENSEGLFKKSSLEAVYYAHELSKLVQQNCIAVSIGNVNEEQLNVLAAYGADHILAYDQADTAVFNSELYAEIIAASVQQQNAKHIVFANTYAGKLIAPRVAGTINAAMASGVISLPNLSNGFVVSRSVFSGKAIANVNLSSEIKVVSIAPNTFSINEVNKAVKIEKAEAGIAADIAKTTSIEISKQVGKIALTEAELVVSAGRGMKGPENWGMVEYLADILGAATACSKPVSDMHWRPHSEHVGQTGITIKPNLYIAIGISGAIQHLAGVSSSKVIVAINKDPEAPFFKAADYGIVGDAFEVLPQLIDAAKTLRSN